VNRYTKSFTKFFKLGVVNEKLIVNEDQHKVT